MKPVPTAEEFTKTLLTEVAKCRGVRVTSVVVEEKFIEFARLHCEAQLKAILENVEPYIETDYIEGNAWAEINKDSIRNAYPLENIK